jgi:hypothetical protein
MVTQAQRDAADKRKEQTIYLGQKVRVLKSPYFTDQWTGHVGIATQVDTADVLIDDRVWVAKARISPCR